MKVIIWNNQGLDSLTQKQSKCSPEEGWNEQKEDSGAVVPAGAPTNCFLELFKSKDINLKFKEYLTEITNRGAEGRIKT